jgi:hypothetical protein
VQAGGIPLSREVNEGIRISAIVAELQMRAPAMNANQQALLQQALNAPPPSEFGTRIVIPPVSFGPQTIFAPPVTVSTIVGGFGEAGGAPASRIDRHYSNRRGYN